MLGNLYKTKLEELLVICRNNLPANKLNEKLISDAFSFAHHAHKHDLRKSGEPFISHPYAVARILATEIPIDSITIASSLLHDVAEDTVYTIADIREKFGDEVAEIVDGVTKIEGIFGNYEQKLVETYKKLMFSMTSDLRVMMIKFADRIHNLRTLEFLEDPRQIRMAQETLEIFAPIAHRFGLSGIKSELEDLSLKYIDPTSFDEISRQLNEVKSEKKRFIRNFIKPIKKRLIKENYKFEVFGRTKHIYSIYNKIRNKNKTFDEMNDIFAVRIIIDTQNKNDCFAVYGLCSEIYIPVPERFKDYISLPKQNGYQSIHTTLLAEDGDPVEVQIRTKDMQEIAEKGIAAHWKYKEKSNLNDIKLESWLKSVREAFENQYKDDPDKNLMETFKLNLYQDEIYCFTPKGLLKVLPVGATCVDFAFEIHTEIGYKCIGAKIDRKIVTLDTKLKSGDQIEIITSKNQTPKRDWEQFVTTHKAKSDLRKYFNLEKRKQSEKGKEIWEKKVKKKKIHFSEENLQKVIHKLRHKELSGFYYEIADDETKADDALNILSDTTKIQQLDQKVMWNNELINKSSEDISEKIDKQYKEEIHAKNGQLLKIDGDLDLKNLKYEFAKCCNPIPGDEVIGFITQTEGIKIHRKACRNVDFYTLDAHRLIEINWDGESSGEFNGGVKIIGQNSAGILNDITNTISKNFNVNIKTVNITTKNSIFEGRFILEIGTLKQLNDIIEKLNHHEGIFSVSRLE